VTPPLALDREVVAHLEPITVGSGTAVMFSMKCPQSPGPNEDTATVVDVDGHRGLLVVADGLGGRPGGEIASGLAVASLRKHAQAAAGTPESLRSAVLEGLDDANRRIMALGIGAGTTLAVVEIEDAAVRGYHVGDAEILAFGQRGRIKYQTVSHSPTSYAVESGLLDHSEALRHKDRHLVSNLIGDPGMRIEIGSWLRLADRDTLVVGSDGLFDNLQPREIASCARTGDPEDAAQRLATMCWHRMTQPSADLPSKPDDLTFILYRPSDAGRRPALRHAAAPASARTSAA